MEESGEYENAKDSYEEGIESSGRGNFGARQEILLKIDEAAGNGGDDSGGSANSGGSTSEDDGTNIQDSGNSGITDLEEKQSTYEGVTAQKFDEAMQNIELHLNAMSAASAVLTVAIFACLGCIAVQNLFRSMGRF